MDERRGDLDFSRRVRDGLRSLRRFLPRRWFPEGPVVPVVRLSGVIGVSAPLRPGLTLASVSRSLERAFEMEQAPAVALVINSPGGSAVQSHLIFTRIRQLAVEKNKPVLAIVEDVAASGGYMLACAADEIIVDASSVVGSIGVIGGSFGFHRMLEKIGIERRLYASGDQKAMLDPFLPEKVEDVERLKAIQREIHDNFIALVRDRRSGKLDESQDDLFNGAYWSGQRAQMLGLADGIGDLRAVLRSRYGDKVVMRLIDSGRGLFGRRPTGLRGVFATEPATLSEDVIATLEARALWGRYGL